MENELEYLVIRLDPDNIDRFLATLVEAEEEGTIDFGFSVQHLTKGDLKDAL